MKREDMKGKVVKINDKIVAAYCKVCGEFTLDFEELICSACRIQNLLNKLSNKKEKHNENTMGT